MSPFATSPSDRIAEIGEIRLIHLIAEWLGAANPPPPAGIGDDCAVFKAGSPDARQMITTDPVVYGKHFDDTLTPEQVARKLVNRNLSDVAAMGGRPALATISLALDANVSVAWIEAFHRAVAALALSNAFSIVGGDITAADDFVGAFLTLIGESTPEAKGRLLTRHRGEHGSPIYVTGELGGTRRGKHHEFIPRLREGQWLALQNSCISCTDVSDGIGKDLANIIAPGCQARVDCARVPIAETARAASHESGKSPVYHAFNDGEDYELLFALAPDADQAAFERAWKSDHTTPITRIGIVELAPPSATSFLALDNAPGDLLPTGYEHLR